MKQRIHKVKKDYGLTNYYDFYHNKYNKDISRAQYRSIITDFNKGLIDLIIETGLIYKMPYIGLELFIGKFRQRPRIVNGKLLNKVPVDWKKTLELWENDEEAKEKKLLVRYTNSHTSGYVFRVYMKKFRCKIKYKGLFKFKPNRRFQRALSKRIKDPNKDNFDAYLLSKI